MRSEKKGINVALQKDYLKKQKVDIKDSEESFRKLTLFIQNAIIMLDSNENIVSWNKAAEEMFGYTYKEVVGKKLHRLITPPEYLLKAEEEIHKYKYIGEKKCINKLLEIQAQRKDGSRFFAEVSVSAIKIKEEMYAVGIVRDISEKRQIHKNLLDAMEAAEAANRAKSQFLANMSHEIRTPIDGIIGFLDLLSQTPLSRQQEDYIKEIKTSSEALLMLVNDLLDFSKIEANKLELEHTQFNLRKIIEEVISSFSLRAYSKGIELYAKIDNQLPPLVIGDPGKIRQVLENLIGNAVKFTHKGKVVITAMINTDITDRLEVYFSIADTGIGISERERVKLFIPFTQVDVSTNRKYGGTGLGLSICEKLITMMSGKINVVSEPNKGSTFSFYIKIDKSKEEEEEVSVKEYLRGLTILIIDQSSTNREIVRYYLENEGCIIREADSGENAIQVLQEAVLNGNKIKLALINYDISDQNGFVLASRIKEDEKLADTVINLFTYYVNPCDKKTAILNGISNFVMKPVFKNDLILSLLMALELLKETEKDNQKETVFPIALPELHKNVRILIAEDNTINQKLTACILNKAGLPYDIAENGIDAINAIKVNYYDLILMDCQMPILDGYEATKQIRLYEAGRSHVTIIALTANALKNDIDKCKASGMDDYISKPFKVKDLLELIFKWLGKDASQSEGDNAIESKAEHRNDPILIDLEKLAAELQMEREDVFEIYNEFMEILPTALQSIQAEIDNGNYDGIRLRAHSIKGTAATLRILQLILLTAKMEEQAMNENIPQCREVLKQIYHYYHTELHKLCY